MKKLFALLIVFVCLNTKAQTWVTIPDANFAHYLDSIIPAAMNGNQMNTSSTLVTTTIQSIDVYNKNISNLNGIQYFTSLIHLFCSNNSLTSLPILPSSITELNCSQNSLTTLPALPNSLTWFACGSNSLTSLPTLPNSLTWLYCNDNHIANLPPIPHSLIVLNCALNALTSFPTLPNSLHDLSCDLNYFTSQTLSTLPDSLRVLSCSDCNLISLPAFPNSFTYLNCSSNSLTTLPTLPNSLSYLDCTFNNIACFPNFPNSITTFSINNNPFNCLPNYITAMAGTSYTATSLCAAGNTNGCAVATGINQLIANNNMISIYPNPCNGIFHVTVSNEQLTEIKIYDVTGKLVLSKSLTPALSKGEGVMTVDASSLSEGVYNVSLTSSEGSLNKRIVIIK